VATGIAPVPLIGGAVDDIDIDLDTQMMTLVGRDHSKAMTDAKVSQRYVNQTSSQIVTALAQQAGLTPQVTATQTVVGTTSNNETAYVTDDAVPWATASDLADLEGFDLYVAGTSLVFAPPAANAPFVVAYAYADQTGDTIRANVPKLRFSHKKTLSGKLRSHVRSWHHQTKQPVSAEWESDSTAAPAGRGLSVPVYRERHSGITQQQADRLAQKRLARIRDQERHVDVNMPGDLTLNVRRVLRVTGTGTAFDQDYRITGIGRKVSFNQGFTMSIQAQGPSPHTVTRVNPNQLIRT
jgi:phage protein D